MPVFLEDDVEGQAVPAPVRPAPGERQPEDEDFLFRAAQEETVEVDFTPETFQQAERRLTKLAAHCREVGGSLRVVKKSATRFAFVCQFIAESAVTVTKEKVAIVIETVCFAPDASNMEVELRKMRDFLDACLGKHDTTPEGLPRFAVWKAAPEGDKTCFDVVCTYDTAKAPPPVPKPVLKPTEEIRPLVSKARAAWTRLTHSWDEKFFAFVTLADLGLERVGELVREGLPVEEESVAVAAVKDASIIVTGALSENRFALALEFLEALAIRFSALRKLAGQLPGPQSAEAQVAFGKALRGVENVARQVREIVARMPRKGRTEGRTAKAAGLAKADFLLLGGLAALGVGTLAVLALSGRSVSRNSLPEGP